MLRRLFEQVRRGVPSVVVAGLTAAIVAPVAVSLADDGLPAAPPRANVAVQPTFTYQGRLALNGLPADGAFDFQFAFFDDETPGAPDVQLALIELDAVPVTDGRFSVELAPGVDVFNGSERWIEVAVRPEGSSDSFSALGARQEITATPVAIYSMSTGPHDHLGETWTGSLDRSGFPAKAIFNVTNTNASAFPLDYGGIGIRGQATASGIGVYGVTTANDGDTMTGFDRNSTIGAVIGQNMTLNCAGTCIGVKGFAGGITTGFGRAYGVYGLGATAGVLGASSATGVVGEGSVGVQGVATNSGGIGVQGQGSASDNSTGVMGESITTTTNDGIGVVGTAGAQPPVRPVNTGVYGYATATDASGVYGRANGVNAVAVRGVAPSSQEFAGRFIGKVEITGTLIQPSDLRLKHDVAALEGGLDAVRALQPKSYVYNDDDSGATRFGLVAQHVREVLPELVSEDPASGMLALNYLDLIPVMVKAIQEQEAEIAVLRGNAVTVGGSAGGGAWALPLAITFAGFAMLVLAGVVVRDRRLGQE